MKIQESGENYLETILILKNRNGYVRSVDVANELSFTKASVSRAMSILRKEMCIRDRHKHLPKLSISTCHEPELVLKIFDSA